VKKILNKKFLLNNNKLRKKNKMKNLKIMRILIKWIKNNRIAMILIMIKIKEIENRV
jgi:hypothetical protein